MAIIEYAVLIAVLVLALVAMSVYLRRAVSARWREAADTTFGSGRQYEPGKTTITR